MEDRWDLGFTQCSVRTAEGNHGIEDIGGQEVYLRMDETCFLRSQDENLR